MQSTESIIATEEKSEPSKKPRRNLDALSSNNNGNSHEKKKIEIYKNETTSINSNYINENIKDKENIPKKPKRNFDALEVEPKYEKRNDKKVENEKMVESTNDISGLEEELFKLGKKELNKPKRDLSKFEKDVNETKQKEKEYEQHKKEKKEKYNHRNNYKQYQTDNTEEIKKEELRLNLNIKDDILFPSLSPSPSVAKTPVALKNISKWNLKSELVSSPINLKSQSPLPNTPKELFKVSKNYQKNISNQSLNSPYPDSEIYIEELYDSDGNIIDEYEIINNGQHDDEYYDDEDECEKDVRDMYKEKDLLEDMIDFIEYTHSTRNKEHVNYLYKLKCNLAEIDDKIQKHEYLERELEAIYGPSYIKYKSLYDIEVEKREKEEEKKDLNNPEKVKRFLNELHR
jgi:hypothetical protein